MDKLENIFDLQEQLNARIGVHMNEMNDEERGSGSELRSSNAAGTR